MAQPAFVLCNAGWNADPNDPDPRVTVRGRNLCLRFRMNGYLYEADEGKTGELQFSDVTRWRLGRTNDEGWYRGQCRYSRVAPQWGEFYELCGPDDLGPSPDDWHRVAPADATARHFLFYLRDETFECDARGWRFERSGRAISHAPPVDAPRR